MEARKSNINANATNSAPARKPASLGGLARTLIQTKKLSEKEVYEITESAHRDGIPFIEALIRIKKLHSGQLAAFISQTFGTPLFDLDSFDMSWAPEVSKKIVLENKMFPLIKRAGKLSVACADPTDMVGLDAFRFQLNVNSVDTILVDYFKLETLIKRFTSSIEDNLDIGEEDTGSDDLLRSYMGNLGGSESETPSDEEDAPVVKFLQGVLFKAIREGASDIHFEPYEKFYRIRFRVDGELHEVLKPPLEIKDRIASRIKVISNLNIAEKRVPQDGRLRLMYTKNRAIDFRVSTLPTLQGEKIVMRILDPTSASLGIDALGYEPEQKAALMDAIQRPYGLILVTGPTGSGKTVSLYTCLNILNKEEVNISTAEDPAEINLPGINQVNVDDKSGLTFAAALKSFLRQDPDIIMVGEIRDLETAEIAVKAAQTGHMVMSTLHTNDAPQTLTRLMNMGVPLFNIASSVLLITAQRLARRLCKACKKPVKISRDALISAGFTPSELTGGWKPYGPVGCSLCGGTGYKGRVGIYQVMPVSEDMQRLILAGSTALDIAAQAQAEGIRDLRQSGLLKVIHGDTSLDEVLGCTNA